MNVFIFNPSNEFLGKFNVGSLQDVPWRFSEFHASNQSIPPFSYLEADGKTWTVVSLEPLELQDGRISPRTSSTDRPAPVSPSISTTQHFRDSDTQPEVVKLLRAIVTNQQRQLEILRAIRWAIVGFSIWFIIQFWFLPKLLLSTR